MEKLKSRKFVMGVVLTALFTILLLLNKLPPDDFLFGTLTLYGIYTGANVMVKYLYNKK